MAGPITGKGCDLFIVDDPMKADESHSATARQRVVETFKTTLYSRLNNRKTGSIILVMQRLHEQDLIGDLLPLDSWRSLVIPAKATENARYRLKGGRWHNRRKGTFIQPERYGPRELAADRTMLGLHRFEAQIQQNPLPFEGNLVKADWLSTYQRQPDPLDFQAIVFSLDPATSADPKADYSAMTIWGVLDNNYYLLDLIRGQFEFPELRAMLIRNWHKWRPDFVLIEYAGTGQILCQQMRREGSFRPVPRRVKGDKQMRLLDASPLIEERRVYLPQDAPWLSAFRRELLGFPNSPNDDQIDSISQFLNWVRNRKFGSSRRQRDGRLLERERPQGDPRLAALHDHYLTTIRRRDIHRSIWGGFGTELI
jgi:predicted phage terminase large subunit-like protein